MKPDTSVHALALALPPPDRPDAPAENGVPDRALYPRPSAAEYLTRKLGVRISKGALEQHATRGTGPAFRIVLSQAVYSRAALDAWAEAQLSAETPHAKRRRTAA